MTNPQSPESPIRKDLVIDAPEYLEEAQNFYDQEPFSRVIALTSSRTATEEKQLRHLLSLSCWRAKKRFGEWFQYSTKPSNDTFIDVKQLTEEQIGQLSLDVLSEFSFKKEDLGKYQGTRILLDSMLHVLNKYPYWISYIDTQLRSFYTSYGEPVKLPNLKPKMTPSYGSWAHAKLRREGFLQSKGIENVFPQDINSSPVGDALSQTGNRRSWLLLDAAELVRRTTSR